VSQSNRQPRTVPTAKVHEWLAWFDNPSADHSNITENRRIGNRLSDLCRRAGAPASTLAAASAGDNGNSAAFDWQSGEISFAPRPGFGTKSIDRLITRVVAVTQIPE
jgi:hypothetical protein